MGHSDEEYISRDSHRSNKLRYSDRSRSPTKHHRSSKSHSYEASSSSKYYADSHSSKDRKKSKKRKDSKRKKSSRNQHSSEDDQSNEYSSEVSSDEYDKKENLEKKKTHRKRSRSDLSSHRKHKKEKKSKSKKKKKSARDDESLDSEIDGSFSDDQAVSDTKIPLSKSPTMTAPDSVSAVTRESWMSFDGLGGLDAFSVDDSARQSRLDRLGSGGANQKSVVTQTKYTGEGLHITSKELNPYLNGEHEDEMATSPTRSPISAVNCQSPPPHRREVSHKEHTDRLNKLQSRILKARMLNSPNLSQLEEELKELEEVEKPTKHKEDKVVILPEFDARGKYVDVGRASSSAQPGMSNKPKKLPSHDSAGNRVRYTDTADDEADIATLVYQEKHTSTRDALNHQAANVMRDAKFEDQEDYLDTKADKLAAHRVRSDHQKRMMAINDYSKTKKALDRCQFCTQEGYETPNISVVSMGHNAYLALPSHTEVVPGHCLIVPGEHLVTSLDGDDATWVEIRNFMKCLMQMYAEKDHGVIFMETVTDLTRCYHTTIHCIPLPWDKFDDAPGYFKEGLLAADEEWSNHTKVIDTRPRTFRRSLTNMLPYFHVWFDLNGGYGHVIEDQHRFPSRFGTEIVAGMLALDPLEWRRPTRYSSSQSANRIAEFKTKFGWEQFDWTKMLD